jgi:lysophospholipase
VAGEHPRRLDLPPGGLAWDETLELRAADGVRLRGALWRADGAGRGLVLMLQGRAEFLEKYTVPAAALAQRGFAAASLDWRGQGRSARLAANPLKGHVGRFADYHLDLAALLEHPLIARLPGRRLVLAHSMGATIALGAALRGRLEAAALILLAPMLGIALTPYQRLVSRLLVPLARAFCRSEAWPPAANAAEPYVFLGFEDNLLTADRAQFDWMVEALRREPGLRLAMPTLGWIGAARDEMAWLARRGALGLPGLCLLGSEEAVVDPAAVRAGAARLGLELAEIAGARHELLIAAEPARTQVWAAIDRFLAARGL